MTNDQKNFNEHEKTAQENEQAPKKAKGFWGKMIDKLDKAMVKKASGSSCCGSGKSKCC